MRSVIFRRFAVAMACGALGACAVMPSTGPSASAVVKQAASVVVVSPEEAASRWADQTSAEKQHIDGVLGDLSRGPAIDSVLLFPGARLNATLWTEPQLNGMSGDDTGKRETSAKVDLGPFTVDDTGALTLPYGATAPVTGLDLNQAGQLLTESLRAKRKFQAPQITLTMQANAHQQIIVAGSANHPTAVNWREGGVSLGEAIAQAGGSVIYEQGQSHALTANHVVIVRKGERYELPLKAALESNVQLRPNDQVLLEHQATVNIQCLGGGWPQNTVQSFDEIPSLSRVVATGGGLSSQQAQGASVFVLSADRRTIYEFRWDTLDGLRAAQAFPLQDADIVYIATAPIVRIQQVANILFSAAYPISTATAIH